MGRYGRRRGSCGGYPGARAQSESRISRAARGFLHDTRTRSCRARSDAGCRSVSSTSRPSVFLRITGAAYLVAGTLWAVILSCRVEGYPPELLLDAGGVITGATRGAQEAIRWSMVGAANPGCSVRQAPAAIAGEPRAAAPAMRATSRSAIGQDPFIVARTPRPRRCLGTGVSTQLMLCGRPRSDRRVDHQYKARVNELTAERGMENMLDVLHIWHYRGLE